MSLVQICFQVCWECNLYVFSLENLTFLLCQHAVHYNSNNGLLEEYGRRQQEELPPGEQERRNFSQMLFALGVILLLTILFL